MSQTLKIAIVAVLFTLCARAALAQDDLAKVPRISQAEFKKQLNAGALVVIDVRDESQYRAGHIPHAISVPLADIARRAAALKNEKRAIVTYCA